jgi:hypothetical protein
MRKGEKLDRIKLNTEEYKQLLSLRRRLEIQKFTDEFKHLKCLQWPFKQRSCRILIS